MTKGQFRSDCEQRNVIANQTGLCAGLQPLRELVKAADEDRDAGSGGNCALWRSEMLLRNVKLCLTTQ